MRISISNLAWDVNEDDAILSLLKEYNVDAIDIAPGKYFPNPYTTTKKEIHNVRNWWSKRGIEIIGMQSLLFGTVGLNVFGNANIQAVLLTHLSEICRIGSELGATRLVFGSPKNRDCSGLTDNESYEIASIFFTQLGCIAERYGVVICLEPNPVVYGANFMTTSYETIEMVKRINHPAIKMQLDTGAIILNNEDINKIIDESKEIIGHIHISESQLAPIGDSYPYHKELSHAINSYFPERDATIEMLATSTEQHSSSIRRALEHVTSLYR